VQTGQTERKGLERRDSSFYGEIVPTNEFTFDMNSPSSSKPTAAPAARNSTPTPPAAAAASGGGDAGAGNSHATPPAAAASKPISTMKRLTSTMSVFNFNKTPNVAEPAGKKCKESDVKAIVDMGFARDQAVWALMQNGHNVVMAINSLTS
jgi:hypothetical protein